jgi:hypothetical protein
MTGTQAVDTWDPLCIGCARGLNNNDFNGFIDEVAVYTNALSSARIAAHYSAASGSSYYNTVTNDNPYLYWRMDSPGYTASDPSTYPSATNYGSVALATAGGTGLPSFYGPAAQPGAAGPQFSGMSDPNGGNNNSYAAAINGIGGDNGGSINVAISASVFIPDAVPIDIGQDVNGFVNPVALTNVAGRTAAIWFKANPNDNRFQNLCGHSDNSWRLALDGNGKVNFKAGNNGTQITSARACSDGNWHLAVATWATNLWTVYIDGVLDTSNTGITTVQTGSPFDVIVGGDPQYLSSGNTAYSGGGGAYSERDFNGSVAHFAYFTNALLAAQIQALYNSAGACHRIEGEGARGGRDSVRYA